MLSEVQSHDDATAQLLQPELAPSIQMSVEDDLENIPLSESAMRQTLLASHPEEHQDGVELQEAGPQTSPHDATSLEVREQRNVRSRRSQRRRLVLHCSRQTLLKVFLVALLLGSTFSTAYIYIYTWFVLAFHGFHHECDVPLAQWLLVFVLLAPLYLSSRCWQPWINRVLCGWSPETSEQPPPLRVKLLAWFFTFGGYYVLFFEMDLVKQAKTCARTAPLLYAWVKYLAPTGVIHFFVSGLLVSCSFTALVMITRASMNAPRPADPNVIRQLETIPMQAPETERQCSICLESYTEGQRAKMTPCCRNIFHKMCLKKWLKQHRTCPLCREDLQEAVSSMA